MKQTDKSDNSGNTVLQITSVSKSYGKRKALDEINLQIDVGEFVALLGPNGAGKTTLFQLLTGLFVADQGSIIIRNYDIRHHAVQALAGIGVVFQQPTLDLDLSVGANLKLHSRLHGIESKESENRIQHELERLELLDRVNDPVRSLSGGNKRKVELARALLHRPQVLLMDEASIGLDPAARQSLVKYVSQLCRSRNVALLWATHLVDEVEHADRVAVLHQGQLLADTTPDQLILSTNTQGVSEAFLKLTQTDLKNKEAMI
ncbi:MAG: ATP-binding cassette domain-containing protein [Proteobacteria bacterium]|nr:ATP-binding cassette domain-containing protein [Pseudomonadota bacterium]